MAGLWRENLATNILSWIACVSFELLSQGRAISRLTVPSRATGYPLTTIELELRSSRRIDQSLFRSSFTPRKRVFDPLRSLLRIFDHQSWSMDQLD